MRQNTLQPQVINTFQAKDKYILQFLLQAVSMLLKCLTGVCCVSLVLANAGFLVELNTKLGKITGMAIDVNGTNVTSFLGECFDFHVTRTLM